VKTNEFIYRRFNCGFYKTKELSLRKEEENNQSDCNTMKLNDLFKKHKELEDEQLRVERFRDI